MDNKKRIKRIKRYSAQMGMLFSNAVDDVLSVFKQTPKLDKGVMFSFDSLGVNKQKEVSDKLRHLHSVALLAVKHGITDEWEYADKDTDELIESVAGKVASDPNFAGWFARNEVAMDAFIGRTEAGLNLSDRIWKPVKQLRDEMEIAMTVSIGEGESASTMSRKVKQYLNDPDLMFRRFRYKIGEDAEGKPIYGKKWKKRIKDEATGTYKWIDYDKDSYKVGAGYYKSASRNAMRVTRTETNMAYRRADNQRWQGLDFVLGQSVHPNNTHDEEDICDQLAGEYPKDFIFDGWHPQCMCIAVPILVPENEMIKILKAKMKGEVYVPNVKPVKDYPEGFKEWVKDNAEKIEEGEKLPYFVRNNRMIVDDIIHPKNIEMTAKERAKLRHNSRTPEQVDAIKKAWAERNHKYTLIQTTANNILKVAKDYGEIQYSKLEEAIKKGNITEIDKITRTIAKDISVVKKKESALSDLIPNAHFLHKSYSMNELQESHKELSGVLSKWLSKYNYSSIDTAPLEHLRNKLEFEVNSPTITYSYREIINKALAEKISIIDRKIDWEKLINQVTNLKSFQTKSSIYKECLQKIDDAVNDNDAVLLRKYIDEAEKQRQKIVQSKIKRSGDAKSALNKEYKGGVVGKDITANLDVSTMVSEDPYRGTFTNNIARIQGFDSPAKLVSEVEFDMLEKNTGDVFYRTVNPTKFKGKNMTSKEFAAQLYEADLLEMNGPGGRVYGDGMYVATSAWDGYRVNPLIDKRKKYAYDSSICYGNGNHTISEMTWTRKPKIIKQDDLLAMWNKLYPKQKLRYGGTSDEYANTYACALGYDAMYCDGVNYMVIWNRSIIAVKKK